ncbi:MAG: hypothetical protein FWF92_08385 [Oscillospiraceae bacterium]|nr:hypothetical protein [Oscillospiraceae bacterium]
MFEKRHILEYARIVQNKYDSNSNRIRAIAMMLQEINIFARDKYKDKFLSFCMSATKEIIGQDILAYIAKDKSDKEDVRIEAIENLDFFSQDSQSTLFHIAINKSDNTSVRMKVIKELDNQDVLFRIASDKSDNESIRIETLQILGFHLTHKHIAKDKYHALLSNIAKDESENEAIRIKSTIYLRLYSENYQNTFCHIAKNKFDKKSIRIEVIGCLNDGNVLINIAEDKSDKEDVRIEAINRLIYNKWVFPVSNSEANTGETLLTASKRIQEAFGFGRNREIEIVYLLKDESKLARIAEDESDKESVRETARNKLDQLLEYKRIDREKENSKKTVSTTNYSSSSSLDRWNSKSDFDIRCDLANWRDGRQEAQDLLNKYVYNRDEDGNY